MKLIVSVLKKTLPLLILILFLSAEANSATYYVATNGNDTNPGTLAQPWKSFTHAAAVAIAGDTVYFRGGTYSENNITIANSGTAGNPITFIAYPGESPIIDGGVIYPSTGNGVINDDRSYITYDGLEIKNGYQWLVGVNRNSSGSNHIFQNCNLHGLIVPPDNSGAIMVGGNGGYTNNLTVQNCFIHDTQNQVNSGYAVIMQEGGFSNTGNDTFINNEIYNLYGGFYYKHSTDNGVGPIIKNNIFHNNSHAGILWNKGNTTIQNNLFYGNGQGIQLFSDDGGCATEQVHDNLINHNTIINGGIWLTNNGSGQVGCLSVHNNIIRNNIIYLATDPTYKVIGIWPYATSDTTATTLEFNNIYDPNYTQPIRILTGNYAVTGSCYKGFIGILGLVSNCYGAISAVPLFVNATNHNYGLATGSPGKNAASDGTDMGAVICQVGVNKASCPTGPASPVGLSVK